MASPLLAFLDSQENAQVASFRIRVFVVSVVLIVLWVGARLAHADGPEAVVALSALVYAVAELVSKLTTLFTN